MKESSSSFLRSYWKGSVLPLLSTLLAAIFSGCVHFDDQELLPAETATEWEERSLQDAGLKRFLEQNGALTSDPWPLQNWNGEELVLAALYFHPDLSIARSRWKASRAAVRTAGARANPVLSFRPEFNSTTPRSLISPWILGLNLEAPLQTSGKRRSRRRAAKQISNAAWWAIASTAWDIRERTLRDFLSLEAARETARLRREKLDIQEAIVEAMEERFMVGAITPLQLSGMVANRDAARLELIEAEGKRREARIQLASAVGISSGALRAVQFDFGDKDIPPPELLEPEARRRALTNRSDILSSLAEYEAAVETLQLEIRRRYPDLQLGPGYQSDQEENKWSFGLSLDLPVFNRNEGPIAEAEAGREEAANRFLALQAEVLKEIDQALLNYEKGQAKREAAESLVAGTRRREALFLARKEIGAIDPIEFLTARAATSDAELVRLQTVFEGRLAFYSLENTLQSPAALPEAFQKPPEMQFAERKTKP